MEVCSKQATEIIVRNKNGEAIAIIDDGGVRTYGEVDVVICRPVKEYTTLEEIERIDCEYLTPRQVASILGCAPYAINCQAEADPKIAVAAAEQIFKGTGRGEEKKKYVLAFLEEKGITFDESSINAAVEAAVKQLNSEGIVIS